MTQETQPPNYPYISGALQGFLGMLPYRLWVEGLLPIDSLQAAEKFVHDNMERIVNDAKNKQQIQ